MSDGHHDEFAEICKEFGVIHLVNEGRMQHNARLTGAKHVRTEFVHFLDDDDYVNHSFYEVMEKHLVPECVALCLPACTGYGGENGISYFGKRRSMMACNISCHVYSTKQILKVLESSHVDFYTSNENFLYFYRNLIENKPTPVFVQGAKVIRGDTGIKKWPHDFTEELRTEWETAMNAPHEDTGEYYIEKYLDFKLKQYRGFRK